MSQPKTMKDRVAMLAPSASHATAPPDPRARRLAGVDPLVVVAIVALLVGTALRATLGADLPLWLDETFTGAIAAQPTLADVGRQILNDVNAPLYYLIAHVWSLGFGLSDAALRFPALVFSALAPALCLVPTAGIPRRVRLVWCVLVALWAPGLAYAQEARCYSLVFMLGVALSSAFASLASAPSPRRAATWAVIASLAILAHYHALVLVGLQGLTLVAIHRRRALALWPAALILAPVAGWMVVASDRIRAFSAAGVAWYDRLQPAQLPDVLRFATGASRLLVLLLAALFVLAVVGRARGTLAPREGRRATAAAIAAATATVGAAVLVVLALLRPSFTMRYLMPFEPGILLAMALAGEALRRVARPATAAVIAFVAMGTCSAAVNGAGPKVYAFEAASNALMAHGPRTLAFFWDNPDNAVEAPSQLQIVGGFFFRRRGLDVEVRPLINPRGDDPNPHLLALAQGPRAAILWIYDLGVHDTAAKAFPPRIAEAPGWRCRDYGVAPVGVLACERQPG